MSKYPISKTKEPFLFVKVTKPTEKQLLEYYGGGLIPSETSENYGKPFQVAEILVTYDTEKYKVGEKWMIGDAPSMKVNFFGEKVEIIQDRNTYGKIDE